MDTFLEMKNAVKRDLTISSTSSLMTDTVIGDAVNRAYVKSGALFPWPKLKDARKTSTVTSKEYYEMPDNWQDESIYRLVVDGEQYGETPDGTPMLYEDYLVWRASDNNAASTDKKWSFDGRMYFIYPVPTTDGSNNIELWGMKVVEAMTADGDTTIFSYSNRACNEAIVLEACAILKAKGEDEKSSLFKSTEARGILANTYAKVRANRAKYEKTQPMFDVPDFFGRPNLKNNIGRFDD